MRNEKFGDIIEAGMDTHGDPDQIAKDVIKAVLADMRGWGSSKTCMEYGSDIKQMVDEYEIERLDAIEGEG